MPCSVRFEIDKNQSAKVVIRLNILSTTEKSISSSGMSDMRELIQDSRTSGYANSATCIDLVEASIMNSTIMLVWMEITLRWMENIRIATT